MRRHPWECRSSHEDEPEQVDRQRRKGMTMERKRVYFCLLLFAFIIFGIFGYGIGKIYGMSIYPDEFGYWANAAQTVGYDWREAVSLGPYYSYGYSILLFPVLKFSRDSVTAYRTAVSVNALMQAGAPFLAWGIYRRLFPKIAEEYCVMAAGMAALYPVWLFYSQMTLTESMLCFLYLLVCYFFVRCLENGGMVMLCVTAVLLIYMYMVHMRTIGILAVFLITLLVMIWQWQEKYGKAAVIFLLAGGGIALTALGKRYVSESIYIMNDAESLAVGEYGSKLRLLIEILTGKRTVSFLLGCAGKLYYLLMTSFGMLIPAVLCSARWLKKMITSVRRKERPAWQTFFALFVMLSVIVQFAITALYMSGNGRLDTVFYGRYNEYLIPLMIGMGALELLKRGNFRKLCLWGGTVCCVLFGITYYGLAHCGTNTIQGDFAAGLSYISDDGNYSVADDFVKGFLFNMALACVVLVCLYMVREKGRVGTAMTVFVLLEVFLALLLNGKYTYKYNEVNYADIRLCEFLTEGKAPVVCYLEEGDYQYIDLIQFTLRETPVHMIQYNEVSEKENEMGEAGETASVGINADSVRREVGADGYLFIRMDSASREGLEKAFSVVEEGGHFVLMRPMEKD